MNRWEEAQAVRDDYNTAASAIALVAAAQVYRETAALAVQQPLRGTPEYTAYLAVIWTILDAAREEIASLAMSRLRLMRALQTNRVLHIEGKVGVTVQDLRDEWHQLLIRVPKPSRADITLFDGYKLGEGKLYDGANEATAVAARRGDTRPLPLDIEPEIPDAISRTMDDLSRQMKAASVRATGKELERKVLAMKERDAPAAEWRALRSELATVVSLDAYRAARDAGRVLSGRVTSKDRRSGGWVRYSKSGTPCWFCAMLISRGSTFYKSEASASLTGDGEKYHTNCNCDVMEVYSYGTYKNQPMFAQNREFERLWQSMSGRQDVQGSYDLDVWKKLVQQRNDRKAAMAA